MNIGSLCPWGFFWELFFFFKEKEKRQLNPKIKLKQSWYWNVSCTQRSLFHEKERYSLKLKEDISSLSFPFCGFKNYFCFWTLTVVVSKEAVWSEFMVRSVAPVCLWQLSGTFALFVQGGQCRSTINSGVRGLCSPFPKLQKLPMGYCPFPTLPSLSTWLTDCIEAHFKYKLF